MQSQTIRQMREKYCSQPKYISVCHVVVTNRIGPVNLTPGLKITLTGKFSVTDKTSLSHLKNCFLICKEV